MYGASFSRESAIVAVVGVTHSNAALKPYRERGKIHQHTCTAGIQRRIAGFPIPACGKFAHSIICKRNHLHPLQIGKPPYVCISQIYWKCIIEGAHKVVFGVEILIISAGHIHQIPQIIILPIRIVVLGAH